MRANAIIAGTTAHWWLWTIDDYGNNSLPFLFRVSNATGTVAQQETGGFDSGEFWIADYGDTTSATITASSTTTISSATVSTTTQSQTPLGATPVSHAAASSIALSGSETTASTTPSVSRTSKGPADISIGVGVGVGVGVGITAVALLLYQRRHQKHQWLTTESHSALGPQSCGGGPYVSFSTKSDPSQVSELDTLGRKILVEAPAGQTDPYELPGEYVSARNHTSPPRSWRGA